MLALSIASKYCKSQTEEPRIYKYHVLWYSIIMSNPEKNNLTSISPSNPEFFDDWEVNRGIATINGDFMVLDREGPIGSSIEMARHLGEVAILDAGCGSGNALIGLKEQVEFRAQLSSDRIVAMGIDLHDYTYLLEGWMTQERPRSGYVDLQQDDLNTVNLEGKLFDLAYSYEVLIHNDKPTNIVLKVLDALKPGGIFYFNTLPEQVIEVETLLRRLARTGWAAWSHDLTQESVSNTDTRVFHKVTKP